MISNQTRKRRLGLLRRRLGHLDDRIEARDSYPGDSYDVAEAYALEWAISCLDEAMRNGLISQLEVELPRQLEEYDE